MMSQIFYTRWTTWSSLSVGVVIFFSSCDKQRKTNGSSSDSVVNFDTFPPNDRKLSKKVADPLGPKCLSGDRDRGRMLEGFAARWEAIPREANGNAKQKEIALEAVNSLGASPELMQFLDFISAKGAGDLRKEIIDSHLSAIFVGPNAKEAREWVLTLNDKKLKEQLCRQAGEKFSGLGFKEYFELTGAAAGLNCQASLLTGYCVTMAKTDPEAAVRVYREFAYPQHIDNSGMADIMSALPADADFLKFAKDIKEDSMTLARRARSALLKNWTAVKPQEAAQYVLSNGPPMVGPEQTGVVAEAWATKSPEEAGKWVADLAGGKPRDEGMAALAKFWCAKDITKAWQFAAQVGELQKRVDAATMVFKEWEKTDKAAATAAWVALFPQN